MLAKGRNLAWLHRFRSTWCGREIGNFCGATEKPFSVGNFASQILNSAKKSARCMSGQAATFRTIKNDPKQDRLHSANPDDLYCDPTEKLQRLLDAPLFGESDKPYRPSKEEMLQCREIFTSRRPKDIKRLESTIDYEQAPLYDLPEIAFMGKSNVGKSSLIKAIFHASPYVNVPTSRVPGHTKTLRFYQVKEFFTLVDMPGYGFKSPTYFKDCVEKFLQHRQNLRLVFILLDGKTGFVQIDLNTLQYVESCRLPYCVVLNKIDLVGEADRLKMVAQVRRIRDEYASPSCFPQPFLVSSKTGEGLGYIQSFIAHITGSYDTKDQLTS